MIKYISILLVFITSTITAQEKIAVNELQADAALLWQAINELHPGPYRHIDTLKLKNAYEDLLHEFSTEKTQKEAFKYLSAFIVKLKCGHTYVNPFNQPNKIISSILSDNVLLPFTFQIIDKRIVVDKSFNEKISDKEIIKCINDITVSSIVDRLSAYIKADGNRQNKKIKDLGVSLESKYNYFDYYFPLIFEFKDSVSLEFDDGTLLNVALINSNDRDTFKKPSENFYDNLWSYSFEEDYAYLKLGSFITWKMSFSWEEYLEKFFEELKQKNINSLIIDIRDNEGGMTEVSDFLLNQLASKKGKTEARRKHLAYKKVSDNLRPHLSTWSKWFYNNGIWTRKLNSRYRTPLFSKTRKKINKNKNAFKGKTYLLINESNSSATFTLAENCKLNNYAKLIGTETGGTKRGINGGQIFFFKLPNTKIEIDIPLIGYYPKLDLPDEGITPDETFKINLDDFKNNIDSQLDFVLELIANSKNE